jgi:hypothetical protein
MITEQKKEDWESLAITQLRNRFVENEDHWVAIFNGGDIPQVIYEDKREYYIFLILQEGYGK